MYDRSDWRENTWLGLRKNRGSRTTPEITRQLELIKCMTLRGPTAVAACRGLLANGEASAQVKRALQEALIKQTAPDQALVKNHKHSSLNTGDTLLTNNAIKNEIQSSEPPIAQSTSALGKYHALIIGNDAYQHFPSLETAIADAKAVAELLQSAYGFRTHVLLNANRYHILSELSRLRSDLTPEANLLIYYAGHGYLDEHTRRGYWLPIDAERSNPANWVSTSDLNDMLLALPAKRVLIVADSCYAGTLAPNAPFSTKSNAVSNEVGHRTRAVLTSGGLELVLDSGHFGHSVFASTFLAQLRGNHGRLTTAEVFPDIRREVQRWSDQTPQLAFLKSAGHTGGDFIFARVHSAALSH